MSHQQCESWSSGASAVHFGDKPVVELYLCEYQRLILKPLTLYWFMVDPGCEQCRRIEEEGKSTRTILNQIITESKTI